MTATRTRRHLVTATPPPRRPAPAPPPPATCRPRRPASTRGAPTAPPLRRPRRCPPASAAGSPRCGLDAGGCRHARAGCGPWARRVVAALLFGLAAAQGFRAADGALGRADANTDQLVRVQAIQTNLSRPTPTPPTPSSSAAWSRRPSARTTPRRSRSASRLIAEAAQHQPADGAALGALNQPLITYASQVEQARANNRQGLPIGAQYLRNASAGLRADALPLLRTSARPTTHRVTSEFDRAGARPCGSSSPACSRWSCSACRLVWLARRTRRYVNVPLAAAAWSCCVTLSSARSDSLAVKRQRRRHPRRVYAATLSHGAGPDRGFDAKSNESLTLIARGSGAAFEKAWQASAAAVDDRARPARGRRGVRRPRPAAVGRLRHGAPARSARSTTAATGTARSRWPPAPAPDIGQRHLRRVRHAPPASSCQPLSDADLDRSSTTPAAGCRSPACSGCWRGVVAAAAAPGGASPMRLEEYR